MNSRQMKTSSRNKMFFKPVREKDCDQRYKSYLQFTVTHNGSSRVMRGLADLQPLERKVPVSRRKFLLLLWNSSAPFLLAGYVQFSIPLSWLGRNFKGRIWQRGEKLSLANRIKPGRGCAKTRAQWEGCCLWVKFISLFGINIISLWYWQCLNWCEVMLMLSWRKPIL